MSLHFWPLKRNKKEFFIIKNNYFGNNAADLEYDIISFFNSSFNTKEFSSSFLYL